MAYCFVGSGKGRLGLEKQTKGKMEIITLWKKLKTIRSVLYRVLAIKYTSSTNAQFI